MRDIKYNGDYIFLMFAVIIKYIPAIFIIGV